MGKVRELREEQSEEFAPVSDAARIPIQKTYKLYIGGEFPRTESGLFYKFESSDGETVVNVCSSSRKDFREAVVAARKACSAWAGKSAFNRGQILYRVAEMLEGRKEQFIAELCQQGSTRKDAALEVHAAIDRLVYYAGWSDKYQQLFSSVNPVSSSHFNFSLLEPMGVVSIIAPEESALLGLVSAVAPVIVGGNACVVLASKSKPLSSITFSEVLHSSDVPGGVVNVLTGFRDGLVEHFSSHMDVNAIMCCDMTAEERKAVQQHAALNVKRVVFNATADWFSENAQSPYIIKESQEIKTTWHPLGL